MDQPNHSLFCAQCSTEFPVFDVDLDWYRRFDVGVPSLCPDCRQQRRLSHLNQLNLFHRTCAGTGKRIVTHFVPESELEVASQEHWYSDAVDNTKNGVEFDFSRPFFEQWHELSKRVCYPALMTDYLHNENSDFTNYAGRLKNCYLLFDSDESRDCYYGYTINSCVNCVDCYRVKQLELCYETIDSRSCYNSAFLENCENCFDSLLLVNCVGCRNCIGCSNLRHKEFHVFNQPVSKEEFFELRAKLGSRSELARVRAKAEQFFKTFPQKSLRGFQNESVSGNYLVHCKNVFRSFECLDLWDGRYCYQMFMRGKDCIDVDQGGEVELAYESSNLGYNAYNIRCSMNALNQLTNLDYCSFCFNGCSDLFGCIALKRKQFCILNKQYDEASYRVLVERIKAHLQSTGEWGEFFPSTLSPHPYNLTLAQLFYPLSEAEALARGLGWRSDAPREFSEQSYVISDHIADVEDGIVGELLSCDSCAKNFKIIPQELAFYRSQVLPVPERCFDCRNRSRLRRRLPRALWDRSCDSCSAPIETSFAPERAEPVYCEKCYLDALD